MIQCYFAVIANFCLLWDVSAVPVCSTIQKIMAQLAGVFPTSLQHHFAIPQINESESLIARYELFVPYHFV